ncbi:Mobile element protein [Methanosarcina siciliae T4/M]|uniref:Mobile element protein n=2 Tax=Methanosarcina siciliae TaxID=38027 RepID=A0A0E3PFL7_9EURY|nr:Mobile element protein [Methanosarcina siciliae T4/M]AKB33169.1 Mobile element protein [Methanosarcina siciliae HI350]
MEVLLKHWDGYTNKLNNTYIYNDVVAVKSWKQKSSKNREKAKQRLAKLHEKISNQRNDFQHKLSFKLVSENQALAVETIGDTKKYIFMYPIQLQWICGIFPCLVNWEFASSKTESMTLSIAVPQCIPLG